MNESTAPAKAASKVAKAELPERSLATYASLAAFVRAKGYDVSDEIATAVIVFHAEWQGSPERKAEREAAKAAKEIAREAERAEREKIAKARLAEKKAKLEAALAKFDAK